MNKFDLKLFLVNFSVVFLIFLIDRISKFYIIKLATLEKNFEVYVTSYLNLYLVWNKGIAFGLLSFDSSFIYNIVSFIILLIIIALILMIVKELHIFKKNCLLIILGGAIGNLFDRIYYTAVPDFIDFHIGNIHWFIFNIADIFISVGVVCLIYAEIFFKDKKL
ncbi:signal peptidase II [Candidatus Pelagibacter sp. Uisw_130]|jgi:signal peptidase II|uniref:signal peptidase II n=1 Tax=Candidatus Pelagibacter sp. Uisw_130 TaxID=3230989 RepID=UPI0039E74AC8